MITLELFITRVLPINVVWLVLFRFIMYRRPTLILEDPNTTTIIDSFASGFLKSDTAQEILAHVGEFFLSLLKKLEERTQQRLKAWQKGLEVVVQSDARAWLKIANELEHHYLRLRHSYETMIILYVDALYGQDTKFSRHIFKVDVPPFATFITRWFTKLIYTDDVQNMRYLTTLTARDRFLLLAETMRSALNSMLVNAITEVDPLRTRTPVSPRAPPPPPSAAVLDPFSQVLPSLTRSPLLMPSSPLATTTTLIVPEPITQPEPAPLGLAVDDEAPLPHEADETEEFRPHEPSPLPVPLIVDEEERALDERLAEAVARKVELETAASSPHSVSTVTPPSLPKAPWTETQEVLKSLLPPTPYQPPQMLGESGPPTNTSSIMLQDVTPQDNRFAFPAMFQPASPLPALAAAELAALDELGESRSQATPSTVDITLTPHLTQADLEYLEPALEKSTDVFRNAALARFLDTT